MPGSRRRRFRQKSRSALAKIPAITSGNLKRYVKQGLHPGHFLASMLCNNVYAAFEYADADNRRALGELIEEIKKMPSGCYGSIAAFDNWLAVHGLEGLTK